MTLAATRYLVELRRGGQPVDLYLHAFEREDEAGFVRGEPAGTAWHRDATRALRFSTKAAADAFIRDAVADDAVAVPFPAADLVRGPHHRSEGEVDDHAASRG